MAYNTSERHPPFHEELAAKVLENLKTNGSLYTPGWIEASPELPFNPVSNNRYRGGNLINLWVTSMLKGWNDPRWMTYKQAQEQGYQVRKGEKGSRIVFVQSTRKVPDVTESGQIVRDEQGNPKTKLVALERPFVRHSFVFNATQIDAIPPLVPRAREFEPIAEAEKILTASGASLHHDQLSRAFYRPSTDSIHLPQRSQFLSAEQYYATALHELCHWTGHQSRLGRLQEDMKFGTDAYAREELRAEIGSLLITKELGLTDDHQRAVGYLSSWVQLLEEQPREILNACADAEGIRGYVMAFVKEETQEKAAPEERLPVMVVSAGIPQEPTPSTQGRTYLVVPYREKEEAKAVAKSNGFAISWDKEAKAWFAPSDVDVTPLAKWLSGARKQQSVGTMTEDPVRAFGEKLRDIGLVVSDPVMDGTMQRVSLDGGARTKKDGAYVGSLEGIPGGWGKNYKTGEEVKWRATPTAALSESETRSLIDSALEKMRESAAARQKLAEEVAAQIRTSLETMNQASPDHPYLVRKGVNASGVLQDECARLVVPLQSIDGEVTSLQRIAADGTKSLEKGGVKKGSFFVVSEDKPLSASCIVIAEGLATAKSVEAALSSSSIKDQVSVVMAVDAYNLSPVAEALHEKFPGALIAFAADNDKPKDHEQVGVGQRYAEEAAQKVGGIVLLPQFSDEFKRGGALSDFNDLAVAEGLSTVRSQLEAPIAAALLARDMRTQPTPPEEQPTPEQSFGMRMR